MVVRNSPLPRMSRRGRATIGVLIGVFVLFTLLGWGVDAWTDWLWFDEVDKTQVFTGVLLTQLLLFVAVGAAMAVVIGANLYLAFRLRPLLRPPSAEQATLERYRMVLTPRVGTWIVVLSVIVGLFAGLSAQNHWQDWLLFRNSVPFGAEDPEFNIDISFYVFEYPFWRYVLGVGFTAVVLAVLGSLAVHYIFGGVRLQGIGDRMTTAARAHLTSLVAVFVLLKAVAYVLDRRALLLNYNSGTDLYGAGYADINALLPAKEILAYISIVVAIAIIVFSNAFMRNLTWPGVSLALLGISAASIGGIYPWAVQTFEVNPSIRDKEAQYIERSINATRDAFNISTGEVKEFESRTLTPPPTLAGDQSTVPNIRLLDPQLVSDTFTQLQQVRGFYDFGEKLDIDRYTVDGKSQDYVVGVREVNYSELTDQQSNWINRHTVYTHGYGLVAAPANRVECNGQPYFVSGFLTNAAPEQAQQQRQGCSSADEEIKVGQPRVYYGEQTRDVANDYAIVGSEAADKKREFDRPGSGADSYYTYTGEGGIPIGSLTRRLLFAIKNAETNFLLSDAVNENSRLMYERDPRSRVEKVAPFLTIDGDPYPAIVDDKIVWILDGYTTSATYPYAQRINLQTETQDATTNAGTFQLAREDVNYMRNSVKATVDAYDGTVTLYEFDGKDPVLKAWNKAFGGDLIKPKSEISPSLMEHLRYPVDMFKVQRNLLSKFHVTDPGGFFTGDDFWAVPNTPGQPENETPLRQPPYYLNTPLGGETAPTFQLTSALNPNGRQNLASIISGYYDANGEPKLQLLELPDSTTVLGPEQIFQRMTTEGNARTAISQLTADGKAQLKYGNLLSLPFGDGILYVQPIYVQGNNENAYPLLQRVLLSFGDGNYSVFANSITEGITQLVEAAAKGQPTTPPPGEQPGGGTPTPAPTGSATPTPAASSPPVTGGTLDQAAQKVQTAINEVRAAQQSGDFERYGRALTALDAAMKEWDAAQKAASTPSPAG
ncbi:UPF0182 family protein [Catenuloplanes sp. NPDC051500]|uniref:UPF0182 family membrane protein n=1 Tax=Catenuloplanes sp. NPDC051500 TaxID=3363959 RepID=UPI0037A0DE89